VAALAAHLHSIACIAFSGDGSLFLSASLDKTLRVWNVFSDDQAPPSDAADPMASTNAGVGTHQASRSPNVGRKAGEEPGAARRLDLRLRPLHRLVGHTEAVTSAAFVATQEPSPDGLTGGRAGVQGARLVASSSLDGTVRLWDMATGEPLLPVLRPLGQAGSIDCVAWSPDAQHVAAGCDDGSVRVWNLDAVNPKAHRQAKASKKASSSAVPDTHEALVLRTRSAFEVLSDSLKTLEPDWPDHVKYLSLASTAGTRADVFSGRTGGWMVAERLRGDVVDGHRLPVCCLAYTRSGSLIVSACTGGAVKVWSAQHGALLRTLLRCPRAVRVRCLALATEPAGRVWVGCADGTMRGARMPEQEVEELAAQAKAAAAVALAGAPAAAALRAAGAGPKGKGKRSKKSAAQLEEEAALLEQERVLAGAGAVLAAGRGRVGQGLQESELGHARRAEVASDLVFGAGQPVAAIAHSGHVAASVTQGSATIELRDSRTLAVKAHLQGHLEPVSCLCMDPAGGWLVSGSSDGAVKVWETDTGQCRLSQPCFRQGVAAVAIQRSVELAAAGSALGDVEVIDFRASTIVTQFSASEARLAALHFANESRLVAFAHDDGVFGLRDLRQNKTLLLRGATSLDKGSGMSKKEQAAVVTAAAELVADHMCGAPAVVAGAPGDDSDASLDATRESSPGSGGTAAAASGGKGKARGGRAGIGGMFGKLASAFAGGGKGVNGPVTRGMCCSPDGFMLVRSLGSVVEVWDVRQPSARLFSDASHSAAVTALLALDDGGTVASAGEDCLVHIWCVPGRGSSRWSTGINSWAELRAGSSQAPGVFDYATRGAAQGLASVSFYCRQRVLALGGFESELFAAGDATGRLYALSLLPGSLGARSSHA
jgi:WD40 repeat protein